MFCPNCGAPTEDGDLFCNTCGSRLENVAPVAAAGSEAVTSEVPTETETVATEVPTETETVATEVPTETETVAQVEVKVEKTSKTCARCGASCDLEDVFCGECGSKVFLEDENTTSVNEGSNGQPMSQPVPQPMSQPVPQPAPQPVYQPTSQPATQPVPRQAPAKVKKAKKGPKKGLLIAVAVIAVIVGVVALNFKALANTTRKIIMSDEEYYQYVEKQYVEKCVGLGLTLYDDYLKSMLQANDRSVSYELRAGVSEDFLEDLQKYFLPDAETDWIKEVSIKGNSSVKDHKTENSAAILLNKKEILSGELKMDFEDGKLYASIPQLFEDYLGVDLEAANIPMDQFVQALDLFDTVYKACPDKSKLRKVASEYVDIIVGELNDVSLKDSSIKAKGVKQNVTKAKVEFTQEIAQNMVLAIMEKFIEDEELREILHSSFDVIVEADLSNFKMRGINLDELDFDETYDKMLEEAERELENLKERVGKTTTKNGEEVDSNNSVIMEVYINGKGEIVGREIKVGQDTISYLAPQDGSELGFKASYYNGRRDREEFAIEGHGKYSGGKVEGDFEILERSNHIVDIEIKKLDIDQLWKGRLRSDFVISQFLPESITQQTGGKLFKNLSVEVIANIDSSNFDITTKFQTNKNDIIEAELDVDIKKGSSVSIPDDDDTTFVEDQNDLMDFLSDIDFDKVIEALDDAGVPEEYLDKIERIFDNASLNDLNLRSIQRSLGIRSSRGTTNAIEDYDYETAPAATENAW